jgi:hypothetical protein
MTRTANSTEPRPSAPASTFVVRFYREWTAGRPRWRGHIEHLQSGEGVAFLDLDKLLAFVRSFGIIVEEEGPGAGREEVEA